MKFDLTYPCPHCPFRKDSLKGWLGRDRATGIVASLFMHQHTFSCHETIHDDYEGEGIEEKDAQHCAGALILMERQETSNQLMRVAERCGKYDRTKLSMDAPVFEDGNQFIDHHTEIGEYGI